MESHRLSTGSPDIVHATCVDIEGTGILISGSTGTGKSALALQLMAFGARLVADDCTELFLRDGSLMARCPASISGLVEARGVGLLKAAVVPESAIGLVVDMDTTETDRLPQQRHDTVSGVRLPVLRKIDAPYFPAAILQYIKAGRKETS